MATEGDGRSVSGRRIVSRIRDRAHRSLTARRVRLTIADGGSSCHTIPLSPRAIVARLTAPLMSTRTRVTIGTLLTVLLASGGASAQHTAVGGHEVAEAPEYARGDSLRAEHRDAEALALFQELHARTQEPRALAQIALTEVSLGRWLDAEAHLIEALTALRDPWVMRNRPSLLATLETMRAHIGTLVISCDVVTAEVWIDGRRAGPVGAPLHVLAGHVSFEVRAEGRPTSARSVSVEANATVRAEVRFSSGTSAASASSPSADPSAEPSNTAPSTAAPASPINASTAPSAVIQSSSGSTQRSLGWASVGTGAALVIGGVAAWFLGSAATDAYNNDATCPGVGAPSQSDACASTQRTAETLEPIAWVAGGAGLALVVTGSVLVATAGDRRTASPSARHCGPVLGPWSGVSCGLSF